MPEELERDSPTARADLSVSSDLDVLANAVDALPLLIAVVAADGSFRAANSAWRASATARRVEAQASGCVPTCAQMCAALWASQGAAEEVEHAILAVARGERSPFSRDYAFAVGTEEFHYQLRAHPMPGAGLAAVSHEEITQRVRSERSLRDTERQLRALLRALPVGVNLVDADGRTLMNNPAARAILGTFQIPAHLQEGGPRLVEEDSGLPVPPGDWPTMLAIATGQTIQERVLRVEGSGGRTRVVSFSAIPMPPRAGQGRGAIGVLHDITERVRATQSLRRDERRQRVLLEAIVDGIVGFDRDGRAAFANPAVTTILMRPLTSLLGASLVDLFGDELAADLLHRRGETIERQVRLPDGRLLMCDVSLSLPADDTGESMDGVASIRDVSGRAEIQAEAAQSQKLQAIGQLAAGVAHEINTPMQFVGDNIRFLAESFADINRMLAAVLTAGAGDSVPGVDLAEVRRLLGSVDYGFLTTECPLALTQSLEGIDRISAIVQSMKEFAHPDGKEKGSVDLNQVASSTATVCRNEWKYVAELVLDLEPALPVIPGHSGDLGQVVLNLLVNAAHAIEERGGNGTITIRTRSTEGGVELAVADDGAGIREEDKSRIFEQFFTTKMVGKGTGQGLSLVRRLVVERHGGKVRFESVLGSGTTFSVFLPN